MKHPKNYFQKVAVILVVSMLLAVPNLRVYSSVGSYQHYSMAITVSNNNECFSAVKGRTTWGTIVAVYIGIVAVVSVAGAVAAAVTVHGKSYSSYKNVNSNYAKYDFSEFDNQRYAPSSMKCEMRSICEHH